MTGQVWPAGAGGGGGAALPDDVTQRLLPTDGVDGMLLKRYTAEDRVAAWVEPDPLGKYRGTWGSDVVEEIFDFADTTINPFTQVLDNGATGTVTVTPMPSSATYASPPPYINALRIPGASQGSGRGVAIEVNLTSMLDGKVPTRVKFWETTWRANANSDNLPQLIGNGATKWTGPNIGSQTVSTGRPWTERDVALAGATTLKWKLLSNTTLYSQVGNIFLLAGIRVYATADPYMFGDVVDHLGSFYKSVINYNANTPGAHASWELIVT